MVKILKSWLSLVVHESLLASLLMLNVFDAVATLYWVESGIAEEANPLMAAAFDMGPSAFLFIKITLVHLSVALLWLRRDLFLSRVLTLSATLVYLGIFFIHYIGFIHYM